jgi:hypothetical protein
MRSMSLEKDPANESAKEELKALENTTPMAK